jgi:hypothetical protein
MQTWLVYLNTEFLTEIRKSFQKSSEKEYMNNIQKCQEAEKQGLRVQYNNPVSNTWIDGSWVYWEIGDRYRIHPDDEQKFINPELKTENPEKISEKPSESLENPKEFMEILTQFQKTLLKSSKDFKFSYETQGDSIKIEVSIQKDSVKTEEDEGWISNVGNKRCGGSDCVVLEDDMLLDVVYRDGSKERLLHGETWYRDWCDEDRLSNIVKFRVIGKV